MPDEPQILGYTALRTAESNSLWNMAQFHGAHCPASSNFWKSQTKCLLLEAATHGDHRINSRSHPQVYTSKMPQNECLLGLAQTLIAIQTLIEWMYIKEITVVVV